MRQTGTVISSTGTMAEISVIRESACGGNCASCGGCNARTVVSAKNTIEAKVGDKVEMEMASSKVLYTAFIVYALPLLLLIVFYFVGAALSGSEGIGIASGFIVMAISYAIIIKFSKKNTNKYELEVEKILD